MLRDGLTAEFPSVASALARLRRPAIPREPWAWAALTGLGATAVTTAVLQLPLIGLRSAGLRDPAAWAASVVAIFGVAIGLAVAWRAGGIRAVALYLGVKLLYLMASIPGTLLFCERSGENCFPRLALGQWTTVAGFFAALVVVTLVRPGPTGRSAALSATGAYVTAQQLLWLPVGIGAAYAINMDRPGDVIPQVAYLSATFIAAAAVAGVVLAVRGARWIGALVPIGVIALNYGLGLWPLLAFEQKPVWTLLTVLTGPAQVIALLVARTLWPRSSPPEPSTTPPS